jgi:hypothetical protein
MREDEVLASASKAKNYSVRDELGSNTHNIFALVPPSELWMMQFVNTFVIPAVTRRLDHSMWVLEPSLPSLRWEISGALFSVQYSVIMEPSSGKVIMESDAGRKSLGIGKAFKEIWGMILDGCKVMVGAFTKTKSTSDPILDGEDLLAKNILVLCEEANGFVLSFRSFSGMFVLHAFARIVRMHTAACLVTFFLEEFEVLYSHSDQQALFSSHQSCCLIDMLSMLCLHRIGSTACQLMMVGNDDSISFG